MNSLDATSFATVSLSYDDASRLATVTQGSHAATYTHGDALQTIDQVRIESSGTERYRLSRTHDNLARVTRIDALGNETTLHTRRDYLYNDANQRTEVTEDSGRKWSFDYDSLGQVIQAEKLESGSEEVLPGYAFGYTFDDIGNRTQTVFNERSAAYTSDALNQYTQRDYPGAVDVRGHAPEHVGVIVNSESTERIEGDFYAQATGDNSTASVELDIVVKAVDPGPPELLAEESRTALLPQDPESFTYDLDGNLTQDGLWTYEWDAENRLIAMESRTDLPASVTRQRLEFAYDSRSRRIQKAVKEYDSGTSSWTTTAHIEFLYDGWNLLAEYDALNGDALFRSHVWGLDLSGTPQGAGGVGGLLLSSHSGADYAPGFDANGNIIAWVDLSDGTLAGTAEYGAFGETLTLSGISAEMPFGFSTKYEDAETSLLYYGFRYYDPVTGRWPSRDPIGEIGGLNVYGFVRNNSVNNYDLLGLVDSDEALEHYQEGSGEPLRMSFDDIDTSSVLASDFPKVRSAIQSFKSDPGTPRTIDIDWENSDDNLPFSTSGDQALFLGDISLKLVGDFVINDDCTWDFSGDLRSFDDYYNFNASTHRGPIGELLTWFGAGLEGESYWIEIRGEKSLTESGDLDSHTDISSNGGGWSWY